MKIFVNDENSIKWIINKSANDQLYIIVPDDLKRKIVLEIAKEMKLYIPKPITFIEFMKIKNKDQLGRELLLYEVDVMLKYLFNAAFRDTIIKTCTSGTELIRKIIM